MLEIDTTPDTQPEHLEAIIRRLSEQFHENHYLICDCKRRLIDIYGHEEGFELENLTEEVLEQKINYCDKLLHLGSILSPGKSELRG